MTQLTEEKAKMYFVMDMRRLLYLTKNIQYCIEGMRTNPICPTWLKNEMRNVINGHNRLIGVMSDRDKGDNWKLILNDLKDDRLHDIAELLDTIMGIKNVSDINAAIKQEINAKTQPHEQSSN